MEVGKPFGALLCTRWRVRARVSRNVGAFYDDDESPFHRGFHLSFRRSTVLPSAALHGNVGYLLGCHEMG